MNHSKLLESDFYEDMFEGSADDDYRPNCKPNKNDDDTIKFGGLDPCQVHVQIMDILHASGRKTKKEKINHFYSRSNDQILDFRPSSDNFAPDSNRKSRPRVGQVLKSRSNTKLVILK